MEQGNLDATSACEKELYEVRDSRDSATHAFLIREDRSLDYETEREKDNNRETKASMLAHVWE